MKYLTDEERRIIVDKGTEAPFSGEYLETREAGTYLCRRCGTALYSSEDKFDAGCGWPSFDAAVPGAVRRTPDPDGRRTEITCVSCGAHLGHVFEGEKFTPKNTRHCVNSLSMRFVPELRCTDVATFAGGCFWGMEDAFRAVPGVCGVVSGYTGGATRNPIYEDVCTGRTGHAEAVRISFDPAKVGYAALARLFFEIHDPTQKDRQGPDVGTQYRSAAFYASEEQKKMLLELVEQLRRKGWDVVTEILPAVAFYPAEEYHQRFTERTGRGGCHMRTSRFEQGPSDGRLF